MIYLMLAVLSSTSVNVLMRFAGNRTKNKYSMLTFNYVACFLLSLLMGGIPALDGSGLGTTVMLGVVSGVFYLGAFLLLEKASAASGVVMAGLFMKLGLLVPTTASVLIFGEKLTLPLALGIVLALAAILLMNIGGGKIRGLKLLLALLLGGGLADLMSKVYEVYGTAMLQGFYLLMTFGTAMVLCALLAKSHGQPLTAKDALLGCMLGIPNFFSSRFLLSSLMEIPAVAAYPMFSVGTIAMVTLSGVVLFREKLTRRQVISIALIAGAMTLLNM